MTASVRGRVGWVAALATLALVMAAMVAASASPAQAQRTFEVFCDTNFGQSPESCALSEMQEPVAYDCTATTVVGQPAQCTNLQTGQTYSCVTTAFEAGGDNRRLECTEPSPTPTVKEQCKAGGHEAFGFRSQGECVAFVERGSRR